MGWSRINNDYWRHPKIRRAGPAAGIAFQIAVHLSAEFLTDGVVDRRTLEDAIRGYAKRKDLEKLIEIGLLFESGTDLIIHDFLDYQISSKQAKQAKESARLRQERFREAKREANGNAPRNGVTNGVGNGVGNAPYIYMTSSSLREEESSPPTPPPERQPRDERVEAVFAAWKEAHGGDVRLTANRRRAIIRSLREGYDVDTLCSAVRGIFASEWHVKNRRTDISIALRDANIDGFSASAGRPMPLPSWCKDENYARAAFRSYGDPHSAVTAENVAELERVFASRGRLAWLKEPA